MQLEIAIGEELEGLDAALRELAGMRGRIGRAPAVSAWSGDQHLYHIALATDLALSNVTALVAGGSPRIVERAEPNELAQRVLAEGRYPRGKSEAPRMVQPPDEVDGVLLGEEYASLEGALAKVRGVAAGVPGAPGAIVHHKLGALSAAHWLRFARLHAEHHLAIVRDVAAAGA